jgi:hypothetical protein
MDRARTGVDDGEAGVGKLIERNVTEVDACRLDDDPCIGGWRGCWGGT